MIDQNGNRLRRNVRREGAGWGVTVWFGGGMGGVATNVQRRIYATRQEALEADVSNWGGVLSHYAM